MYKKEEQGVLQQGATKRSCDKANGCWYTIGVRKNSYRLLKEWVVQIREDIPFPLFDIDSDNGGGFINHQLLDWYIQHGIKFTRSRPCHKNDNLDAQYCTHYAAMFGVYTVESESLINGWHISTIGEYTDLKSGYAFKSEWWQDTGYKVIKTANVSNNSIDLNNCDYVSTANTTKSSIFSIATPSDDDCFTYKFIYVKTGAANTGKVFFLDKDFYTFAEDELEFRESLFSTDDQPGKVLLRDQEGATRTKNWMAR